MYGFLITHFHGASWLETVYCMTSTTLPILTLHPSHEKLYLNTVLCEEFGQNT